MTNQETEDLQLERSERRLALSSGPIPTRSLLPHVVTEPRVDTALDVFADALSEIDRRGR
jgi:hypothetical protein